MHPPVTPMMIAEQQIAAIIGTYADVSQIVLEIRKVAKTHRMSGDLDAAEHLDAHAWRLVRNEQQSC